MTQPQLIPKRRKRKLQPTASMYREQLRLAADRIIDLEQARQFSLTVIEELSKRSHPTLWQQVRAWRLWNRLRVRVVETEKEVAEAMKEMHGG